MEGKREEKRKRSHFDIDIYRVRKFFDLPRKKREKEER